MSTLTRARDVALRMAEVPRVAPFRFRAAEGAGDGAGDGMTLDGYASVFNAQTIIDSWEGRFKEQFLSGSMKRSFREQTPIIQFDHGRHAMIGSIPVAAFERGYPVEETDPEFAPDGGAHVVARMLKAPLFEPVREAIAERTITGMSIRFGVVREKWYWPDGTQVKDDAQLEAELWRTWREDVPDDELLRRDIIEARVAEMGPVVWPAYTSTSVGVRSLLAAMSADQRHQFAREVAAELRRDPEFASAMADAPTDLIAAPGAPSAGGEEPDADRQSADDASRTTADRRARRRDQHIRARGIPLGGKAVQR